MNNKCPENCRGSPQELSNAIAQKPATLNIVIARPCMGRSEKTPLGSVKLWRQKNCRFETTL